MDGGFLISTCSLFCYIMSDYEFRPQKKKARECLSVGQGAGEDPSVSSFDLQTIPPVPSMSQAPTTCSFPSVISYMVGYYPYTSFGPYHATSLYPSIQSNISRSGFFRFIAYSATSTELILPTDNL